MIEKLIVLKDSSSNEDNICYYRSEMERDLLTLCYVGRDMHNDRGMLFNLLCMSSHETEYRKIVYTVDYEANTITAKTSTKAFNLILTEKF